MHQTVREVMTPNPKTIKATSTVTEAAQVMREHDIGDVLVLDGSRLAGILTDRDVVVRGVAEDLDPKMTRAADICSRVITIVRPETGVGEAVRLMREHAVRRLPVLEEDGSLVGIVSLGDLAIDIDRPSVLAQISAAPPNV
jgi:CBS domain-containing protein